MKHFFLVLVTAIFLSSCGGAVPGVSGSSSKLGIKLGGPDKTMDVKSGGVYYGNTISTAPGKPNVQTSSHYIVIANYEMDTTNLATMKKPITAPDQIRVMFALTGEEGTNTDTPFKTGTYDVKADKANKVRSFGVTTFADGKEKADDFDTMSSMSKAVGTVKITSVTADSVSGEIDMAEGDKSVKGNFTAKLPVKK